MLTGNQLLNQVFENREDDIKDIIRKSGYTAVTKAGKEKILFTPCLLYTSDAADE